MKTQKQLARLTARQLADLGYDMGLGERDLYRFRGGPLQKAVLIENILKRQAQLQANAEKP